MFLSFNDHLIYHLSKLSNETDFLVFDLSTLIVPSHTVLKIENLPQGTTFWEIGEYSNTRKQQNKDYSRIRMSYGFSS